MSLGPTLETERLILRPPELADVDSWAALMGHETSRFIGGPVPRLFAWRGMMAGAGDWALRGFGMFSVIEKASGRWVGRVGAVSPEGWPGTEVGWAVAPEAQGRGYASEASAAAMDWVVEGLGWTDIIHTIDPANAPSEAVARKLGSVRRGPVELPPPLDSEPAVLWGQSAADWRVNRKRWAAAFP